jgi:hypothetical protein
MIKSPPHEAWEIGLMRLVPIAPAFVALLVMAGQATGQPPNTGPSARAAAPAEQRDPEAIAALERMGGYLRSVMTFGINADITSEEVLETGQTIQYTGAIDLVAQRPGHLRANFDSTRKRRQYFYDGHTLTIWAPRQGFYATVAAPPSIKEMLQVANDRLNVVIPFADLFEFGVNPELTSRLTSATVIGVEAVEDQTCTHYAFRQPNVDWEIWIRTGEQPLVCMYRITDLRDPARPDYVARLTWDLNPTITPETFTFVAPPGAESIPVARLRAAAQGARP